MRSTFTRPIAPMALSTREGRIAAIHGIQINERTTDAGHLVALDATLQDERGNTWRDLIPPHQLRGRGPVGENEAAAFAALCRQILDRFPPMNAARASALAAQKHSRLTHTAAPQHHASASAPCATAQDEPAAERTHQP